MSSVVLSGDSSGSVTLTVPSAAGTNTATLPASTGTVMVSGNMPAFSAYQSSQQTLSTSTWTKIQFQTKEFDTANCFDATTNYRFTPTVSGYYQINSEIITAGASGLISIQVYKNGVAFKNGTQVPLLSAYTAASVNSLIYLNGSTDYIEIYGYQSAGVSAALYAGGATYNYFQAYLARTA